MANRRVKAVKTLQSRRFGPGIARLVGLDPVGARGLKLRFWQKVEKSSKSSGLAEPEPKNQVRFEALPVKPIVDGCRRLGGQSRRKITSGLDGGGGRSIDSGGKRPKPEISFSNLQNK
jgi:hypothetical protein